jgi:hypothetical protein
MGIHFIDPSERQGWAKVHGLAEPHGRFFRANVARFSVDARKAMRLPTTDFIALDQLMAAIAQVMRFPDTYNSQDGFLDWLSDLTWLPADFYLVELTEATWLWQQVPRVAGKLVELWLAGEGYWEQEGKPLELVFVWSSGTWYPWNWVRGIALYADVEQRQSSNAKPSASCCISAQ